MKVHIGDEIDSDFGPGKVVAMTKQWCIHMDKDGKEWASPWRDIRIAVEGPNVCHTQEIEHELRAEIQKANKGIRRLKSQAADLSEVASDYAGILNHVDEFCTHRAVSLSGRGGVWKLFVCGSHGSPSIAILGNDPLGVLAEFRRVTTPEGNLIDVSIGGDVFIDLTGREHEVTE